MVNNNFLDSFDFSRPTSLYIHVPFCSSKCLYCAFYSVPSCRDSQMDMYVEKLVSEINLVNERMGGNRYVSAFIGGGNPGFLGPKRLEYIAKAVCRNGRPYEFTTEMNPENLTEEFFYLFEKYFTRLSMGVQSINQKALTFLGRNSDLDSTLGGMKTAISMRRKAKCKLSFDLITCLGPKYDNLSDIISVATEFRPDHLSVYALTLEEGTPLYRKNPPLPNSDQQFKILTDISSVLTSLGYRHYEVSNYARLGSMCLHNILYWKYEQFVGLGPGASSTAFSKSGLATRHVFRPSLDGYLSSDLFGCVETENLTKIETAEELILMGLRYYGGLNLNRLESLLGYTIPDRVLNSIPGFHVIDKSVRYLVPDEQGYMTSDAAAYEIVRYLQ